jgi:hypothetical protein
MEGKRHRNKIIAQKVSCSTFLNGDIRFMAQRWHQGTIAQRALKKYKKVFLENVQK